MSAATRKKSAPPVGIVECQYPDDHAVVRAMDDLERPVRDLEHMAAITAYLAEHAFGNPETQRQVTGRENTYYIHKSHVEQLLFAIYHVQDMAEAVSAAFLAALELDTKRVAV